MKLTEIQIWTITFISGVLTGLIFNSFYGFLNLATLTAIFIVVIFLVFLVGLVVRGNRIFRIVGFIFFFFLFASTTSFTSMRLKYNLLKSYSEKIILAVTIYYNENNKFPSSINNLGLDNKVLQKFQSNDSYKLDSTKRNFTISFNSDGATTYTYHSLDKLWTYSGFEW